MPDGAKVQQGSMVVQMVTLAQESDVERWCSRWHCTEAQLQRAVKAVGHQPSRVEEHLVRKYGPPGH